MPTPDHLAFSRRFWAAGKAQRLEEPGAADAYVEIRNTRDHLIEDGQRTLLARALDGHPLVERLTAFWADHFAIASPNPLLWIGVPAFVDEAIRPHVLGRFEDMLIAVATHPLMLDALDQFRSAGPDSRAARRHDMGLNENFARELLELHTLGVDGGYTQDDVRETALLLAGLGIDFETGFRFRQALTQPGRRTIRGRAYRTGGRARLADVIAFLRDLARDPATARHIATKIAVHFVAPEPPQDLVNALADSFVAHGGDLNALATVLVSHPDAGGPEAPKARSPAEFVLSGLTALGVSGSDVMSMPGGALRRRILHPMARMGQPFLKPPGPDGWSEDPAHWITAQGLAARIAWAVDEAARHQSRIDDPRAFLDDTLGPLADPDTRFAVSAAETRQDGLALVLASVAFNRR